MRDTIMACWAAELALRPGKARWCCQEMLELSSTYFTLSSFHHPLHDRICPDYNPMRAMEPAGKTRLKPYFRSWAELQEAVLLQREAVAAEQPAE